MSSFFNIASFRAALAGGALALAASAPAQAIVYSFTMTGGAKSSLAFSSSHLFVDVTENSTTPANDVSFTFTNEIPVPNRDLPSSIVRVYFDTGAYTSLFTGMAVTYESAGVEFFENTPGSNAFLPSNFSTDYRFGLGRGIYDNQIYGIQPGESATLTATLGTGYSFADVIDAMNKGINASTATTGLRVGVFTYYVLGTMRDDAAHVASTIVPVPEPETWVMMLAALGLVGFMVGRRKA